MPKPLFTYRLYCETCGPLVGQAEAELTKGVPQTKASIDEMRRDHAAKHERGEI